MFTYEVLIREYHLDTFGHMNNAAYLALFEETRWELITAGGYGLKKILETGKGPIVLEANVKFLKEIKLREKIKITAEPMGFEGKIGKMKQQMIKEDGKVACEALFTFGFFDTRERKLISPTPEWIAATGPRS